MPQIENVSFDDSAPSSTPTLRLRSRRHARSCSPPTVSATIHSLPDPVREPLRRWRFASSDNRTGVIVRHEVGRFVAAWTGDAERRYDGELAFGEMFANVVRHAPGAVEVVLRDTPRASCE
jgi:hypothetical protein